MRRCIGNPSVFQEKLLLSGWINRNSDFDKCSGNSNACCLSVKLWNHKDSFSSCSELAEKGEVLQCVRRPARSWNSRNCLCLQLHGGWYVHQGYRRIARLAERSVHRCSNYPYINSSNLCNGEDWHNTGLDSRVTVIVLWYGGKLLKRFYVSPRF